MRWWLLTPLVGCAPGEAISNFDEQASDTASDESIDSDGDGYTLEEGDCDDSDAKALIQVQRYYG